MKSFRRNEKGQFVIIAALLISVLTLSLIAVIGQVALNSQVMDSKPVNELLLGITSDMERALTKSLSQYTYSYYTGESSQPAFDTMTLWKKAILTSYSGLNLEMNDAFTPDFSSTKWQNGQARSAATIEYSIDVNAYGFKGWTGITSKYVNLQLFPNTIETSIPGQTTFEFQLNQSVVNGDQTQPIPNLTPDSIIVGTYCENQPVIPATEVTLRYLGSGNYAITFNEETNPNTRGVSLTIVTPDDNIWISTHYYQEILLTFNTREASGSTSNLGTIRYIDTDYSGSGFDVAHPVTPSQHGEKYYLKYTPSTAYRFVGWSTNSPSNIQFVSTTSATTAVTVLGTGTITATYESNSIPPPGSTHSLVLDSQSFNSASPTHEGTITFNTTPYTSLPASLTVPAGSNTVTFTAPNASTHFLYWQFSDNIFPTSPQAPTMTITVSGDAQATALYIVDDENPPPPPPPPEQTHTLILDSQSFNSAVPTHEGTITFNTTPYTTLPQSLTIQAGTNQITYTPPNASTHFLYWAFSDNISPTSPQGATMTIVFSGDAQATAVYIVDDENPPPPPPPPEQTHTLILIVRASIQPSQLMREL